MLINKGGKDRKTSKRLSMDKKHRVYLLKANARTKEIGESEKKKNRMHQNIRGFRRSERGKRSGEKGTQGGYPRLNLPCISAEKGGKTLENSLKGGIKPGGKKDMKKDRGVN